MSGVNNIITVILLSLGDYYAVDGEDGTDTLVIEAQALSADLTAGGLSPYEMTHSNPAQIAVSGTNFEMFDITGGSGDDVLSGHLLDDRLIGGPGNDTLDGLLGSDTLDGGDGDDDLRVGQLVSSYVHDTGPDVIDGGSGFDRLSQLPRDHLTDDQSITINFLEAGGASFSLTDGTSVSNIQEIRGFTLGSGDDDVKIVPATISDRNIIDGGDGDDYLNVTFNHFTDDMYFSDIVSTSGTYSLHKVGTPVVDAAIVLASGFDRLRVIGGSGDDTINGTDLVDRLEGGPGNDRLSGQDGNDTLIGGEGDDILFGHSGNNRLVGGPGADELRGSTPGIDTANYLNSPAGVTIDIGISTAMASGGDATGDTLFYINAVDGSQFDDVLRGSYWNNLLRGAGGNDIIEGRTGNDALGGGDGDDQLFGDHGADRLYGDAGNDTLHGGRDNDRFWGGDGDDTFVIKTNENTDKIMDFDLNSSDVIDLTDLQIADFATLQSMMSQSGAHVQIMFDPASHPTNPADMLIIENVLITDLQPGHFQL